MSDDYANARCAAITRAGHRCTGRWATALPIMWSHDPTTGASMSGPYVVLCARHRHLAERVRRMERIKIAHGYLGAANQYGYGAAVWARATGRQPAAWYWARRRRLTFGQGRKDAV